MGGTITKSIFQQDVNYYSRLYQIYRYTSKADDVKTAFKQLLKIRSRVYLKAVADEINRTNNTNFYSI